MGGNNALDWLARLVTHIPSRYEQTVRYYGYYSNKSRGMRKKAGMDDTITAVIPNEISSKEFRQNWARLIQKVYEVDPLLCPKCQGIMKIISFIEDLSIIEKIQSFLKSFNILYLYQGEVNISELEEFFMVWSTKSKFLSVNMRPIVQV